MRKEIQLDWNTGEAAWRAPDPAPEVEQSALDAAYREFVLAAAPIALAVNTALLDAPTDPTAANALISTIEWGAGGALFGAAFSGLAVSQTRNQRELNGERIAPVLGFTAAGALIGFGIGLYKATQ